MFARCRSAATACAVLEVLVSDQGQRTLHQVVEHVAEVGVQHQRSDHVHVAGQVHDPLLVGGQALVDGALAGLLAHRRDVGGGHVEAGARVLEAHRDVHLVHRDV